MAEPFDFTPEETGATAPDEGAGESSRIDQAEASSTGVAWGAILVLVTIALVVVFAVQNTDPVPVSFLWMDGEFSLAIVILVTAGVIIVLTELAGLAYRRRRRRRIADREELRRLRGSS